MHITEQKLKDILVEAVVVDEKSFEEIKQEALRLNQSVIDVLIGERKVTEEYLVDFLKLYFGAPSVNLEDVEIKEETLKLIPEAYAKLKRVIIFDYDEKARVAKAAMTDPLDYDTVEFLRAKLGAWVEPYLTTSSSLKYGLRQYKEEIGTEFGEVITKNVQKFFSESGEADLSKLAEAVSIITILNAIIEHAISQDASDIHFESFIKYVLVRYRIDGILREILTLHKAIEPILVARVKILSNLQIDEHSRPQDGRFRFSVGEDQTVDIRVSVMPVMRGEKVEMRLLKSSARPLTLDELGFSKKAVSVVREEIKKPHGMILITGPTGHGKTTTLYTILNILNTPKVNIMTIEDPIEYEIAHVNQTQINLKAGITFATGLRSILRQNPDIITVGEIRDSETVNIAIHASLTGHLLLSTLHTNDAPSALPRLIDMGGQPFLVSSTINLVIAQRLVRKICTLCVESFKITPEIERLIAAQLELSNNGAGRIPKILYRGRGCKICDTSGYHGQIGIFEVLQATEPIKKLILKSAPAGEIRAQAIKGGMVPMFEDGLAKVERAITTIEEIVRVVRE